MCNNKVGRRGIKGGRGAAVPGRFATTAAISQLKQPASLAYSRFTTVIFMGRDPAFPLIFTTYPIPNTCFIDL